ncbi:hypothetical protein N7537_009639 [Penicillium hordei]|uniref:NmrA-like domain-containing protein n=1 Tax=Penicillium hordei TaxID=40994 RepID=A0AAD6DTV3_9EURO|nr:uncharacterized protein N7537_009639 [Penicillium hordei]KAJ5592735.1 hypothetical protein N7537_009639 [Penicillium hordei]
MTIAIAGCGPVGITILETLLESSKYQGQIVILTRTQNLRSTPLLNRTTQIKVDYNDVHSTTTQLEAHQVHTVICTFGVGSVEAFQAELDLIKACERSVVTRRFIPSEYSFPHEASPDIYPEGQYFIDVVKALKKANLEYTRIFVGTFMDYWGMPNTRTHIGYFGFGVEISSARALIPGDGNDVFTVTYSYDMARFIVGLLDLESWPETCHFSGDDITFNQILDQAQRLRGKKFDVTYVSVDRVKKNQVPPVPQSQEAYYDSEMVEWLTHYMSLALIHGEMELPRQGRMNTALPHIQPISISEFLTHAWSTTSSST